MKNDRPLVNNVKTQKIETITLRAFLVTAAVVGMLLLSFTAEGFGQKEQAERATTRDGLISASFLTTGEISDDLDGNDDEYFYKFKAGPGKLTVTLEVTANETNAGAMLDLFSGTKPILSNMLVQAANRGSEMAFQSVTLSKAQDIVIRIKGMKYGSTARYPGVYKLLLDGPAVNFKDATPSEGPVEVKKPDAAPPEGPVEVKKPAEALSEATVEVKKPDEAPSDVPVEVKKPDEAPSDGTVEVKKPDVVDRVIEKGKTKSKKLLNLLDKVKSKIPDQRPKAD